MPKHERERERETERERLSKGERRRVGTTIIERYSNKGVEHLDRNVIILPHP